MAGNTYWPWWRFFISCLNILALVLTAILSWHYLEGGSMAGCDGKSSCAQVLGSRWSTIGGVLPVSGLAMGVYLAMFVASFFIGPSTETSTRRFAWAAMLFLAGSITGSAIWFIIVQKWLLKQFCVYCTTTHIIGLLLAVLVIWRACKGSWKAATAPRHISRFTIGGFAVACIMVITQFVITPGAKYASGRSQGNIPVLDYREVPIVGSIDAPYVVTLLFDYQCPHCQKLHFLLDNTVKLYEGKLAFALCPAPLNARCNPYTSQSEDAFNNSCELARIGLAVWLANRKIFPLFENWMFSFDSGDRWRPRSLELARAKAIELVGQAPFDVSSSDPWIDQYIQTCTGIYGKTIQNGKGGVPKLIFDDHWVIPEPDNANDLVMILQKSLGIPKP